MNIKYFLLLTLFITKLFSNSEELIPQNINFAISKSLTQNTNYENESLSGISTDFWNLIKEKTNINANVKILKDFDEIFNQIKNKKADITFATTYDENKKDYVLFSKPYISFPIAFATLHDKSFIPNASFLKDFHVAVAKDSISYIKMKNLYPKIKFKVVKNTKEALKLLSAKEVDVAIDILPNIARLISINGYSNIKIAGVSEKNIDISFMIRNDYSKLLNTINKQIDLISQEERNSIINKWLTVKFDKKYVDKNILINITIISFILIILFFIRQRSIKKYNNQLQYLSNTDSLTKLNNRRKIDKILNEEIKNKKFSLILLDIDYFKRINDDFGHLIGDEVLIRISEILKDNINSNDIIGRWGGEEFLIICKNTPIHKAQKLANRLKNLIENEDFKVRKVTASFGISEAKKELTLKDILANADKALYKAKENGRNQIVLSQN